MQKGGSLNVDEAYSVVVDNFGNSYATGYFTGTATFGTTSLTSSGSSDIFIAKINSTGVYQWALKAGGTGNDRGLSIALDGSNNVFVTGYFNGSADFSATTLTSSGLQDMFIAKYSTAGVLSWAVRAGGTDSDIGNGICVDNSGNVIVTGEFKGISSFGPSSLTSVNGSTDVFITKLNGLGVFQWTQQGSGTGTNRGIDIGCDASGNVYATGQFSENFTFDVLHTNTMFNVVYLVKFNSAGVEQWFKTIGGGTSVFAYDLDVNSSGNIFIAGDFTGNLTFFNSTNTTLTTTYSNEIFVAKYANSGTTLWASKSGSNSAVSARGVAADASGNVFVVGQFECAFDEYMEEYGDAIFNSVGYEDIFISKFNSSGVWSYSKHIGSRNEDYGLGIDINSSGQAIFAGSFKSGLSIPTSSNFINSNLSNWSSANCASNNGYCGDPDYGTFHKMTSIGNSDIIIANCFDPNRDPYDYYQRSGNGCIRDIVSGCINTGCPDTVSNCNSALVTAFPITCSNVGPSIVFNWSNGASGTTVNQTFFASSGYKWVDFTTKDGCFTHRDSIYVNIFPNPPKPFIEDDVVINTPTPFPVQIDVCIPDTVKLTGSNFTGNNILWTGTGLPPSGVQDSILYVTETGVYTFTVVNAYGCSSQSSVPVTFFDPLDSFELRANLPDTVYICENVPYQIILFDSVDNPLGVPICFTDSQPYINTTINYTPANWTVFETCETFFDVSAIDTGWFSFDITLIRTIPCDTDTFYLSDSIYFVPFPAPQSGQFSIEMIGSQYFCPGGSVMQYGSGSNNYTWTGPSVNGLTNDSLFISTAGTYSISSILYDTNIYGCVDSATASAIKLITQKPQPLVTSTSLFLCPNDTVWLTVANSGASQGFFWEGPNGPIPGDSSSIIATNAGTYFCVVNDTDSCDLSSNSIILTQYTTPSLASGGNLTICDGDSVILNVVSSAGSQIEWLPPLSGSGTSQTVYEPGIYTCKIVSCGIETFASIEVFPSYVESEITPSGILCFDSTITLYGTVGMSTYQWSGSPSGADSLVISSAGTYTLTTTDSTGCSKVSDPITITITQEPTQISISGYPVFCNGDSITLFGNSNMNNYLWLPIGDTTQNITTFEAGIFTLRTVDSNGCKGSSEPLRVSIPDTIAPFNISSDLDFCEGDSVDFRARRGGMAEYLWLPDSAVGRTITLTQTGKYSLITTDTFGCLAWSDSVSVYVQPNEIDKPFGDDTLICAGSVASLSALNNIGTLKWSERAFGNVINEGEFFKTPALYQSTPYYVWSDFELCRGDTGIIYVTTMDCETAFIPNVFTPNGDGYNEYFTIRLNEIQCFHMDIYNRWGVKLFETDSVEPGWDGTIQNDGNPAPEGTYYYVVDFCRFNGTKGDLKGSLTLIRN